MKKWTIALALLLTMSMDANAQGFLKRLKDKAVEKVKDKIENDKIYAFKGKIDSSRETPSMLVACSIH